MDRGGGKDEVDVGIPRGLRVTWHHSLLRERTPQQRSDAHLASCLGITRLEVSEPVHFSIVVPVGSRSLREGMGPQAGTPTVPHGIAVTRGR